MALDISALLPGMLDAARGVLQESWPEVQDYAETEFRKTGETLGMIEKLYGEGAIDEEGARFLLDLQKLSTKNVLLTAQGLGMIAVERAVNEALGVVKDTVNTALGFTLL